MATATTPEQDTPTRWDNGQPADLLADLRWAMRQPSAPERGPVICSPAQAENLARIEAWLRGGAPLPVAGETVTIEAVEASQR